MAAAPSSSSSTKSASSHGDASDKKTSLSTDPSTANAPSDSDPTADFVGDVAVTDQAPSHAELAKVADHLVLGADGTSRPFKSLYSGEGVAKRVLVLFVRHFLCGNCQEFLRTLSASVTPDALLSLPTPTFITIIGCGRPEMIPMYVEATGCPFPVYADPSRKLYDLLGMTRTLSLGQKPAWQQTPLLNLVVGSFVQAVKQGTQFTKAGDIKQVGGEFMIEDGKVTWCHRMRNTRDHSEMKQLREVLGLDSAVEKQTDGDQSQPPQTAPVETAEAVPPAGGNAPAVAVA